MKFGIVFNSENKKAKDLAREIEGFILQKGHKALGEKSLVGADVIISLGGDGTLIHKSCEFASLGVPFVGINTGNLGFLTAVEAGDWREATLQLLRGEYFVSERITLAAKIAGREVFRAVNEVAIKGFYRVVDLEISVGEERLLRILGDGVIVSTQTGSTAYSLSAGGPIVDPSLDCLLLTPINPIGLPIPSLVISPDSEVNIKVIKGDDISLVLDGQEHTKLSKDNVKISKGEYKIKFIYFEKNQFIKSLNAKFGLSNRLVGK
ncbi:hypothetical protein A3A60_01165 [Candidatus Curtissbacteria bacterium RIFCSPLOWO2_01_FULL_42_26]|uniref:NAD kinase n=1 Tax=Candidatus Curtissbacteria bacterium RIFCSPLOWO2_01_FULL_42_26 TaxID=1797729 RepID=A0A1F5HYG7_9BACT|nr:MAG: hypothetical protein A3A60_01165 [Candidatus Curtissbacteria bacterium RIFCSPLOWO2_01_FULL_42_26]